MSKKIHIPIRYQYVLFSFLPVGVLVLGIFLTHTFYEKLYEKREAIYNDIALARWEKEQISSLGEFARQREEIESSEEITERFVLKEEDKIQFITFIEQIALEKNLAIDITTKTQEAIFSKGENLVDEEEYKLPTYEGYDHFDLEVIVEGDSDDMLEFLYRLENAPTYIYFSSVAMEYYAKEEKESYARGSGLLEVVVDNEEKIDIDDEEDEFIVRGDFFVRMFIYKNPQEK
jgi:hypothetical protein